MSGAVLGLCVWSVTQPAIFRDAHRTRARPVSPARYEIWTGLGSQALQRRMATAMAGGTTSVCVSLWWGQ